MVRTTKMTHRKVLRRVNSLPVHIINNLHKYFDSYVDIHNGQITAYYDVTTVESPE